MPKEFEDMVAALQRNGKTREQAYAIATANWKRQHQGKIPTHKAAEAREIPNVFPESNNSRNRLFFVNQETLLLKQILEELVKIRVVLEKN